MLDIKEVLLLCFIKLFDKETVKGSGVKIKKKIKQNEQLAEELRKPIIRKF